MSLLVVFFNILMVVVDFAALRRTWRNAAVLEGLRSAALVLGSSLLLSHLLGLGSSFRVMGLFAYGIFLHLPVVLLGIAFLVRKSPRAAAVSTTLAMGLAGVAVFSFAIEPFRLEVSDVPIESPEVQAPVRIALISDLQADAVGSYERHVLARVMAEAPDLILLSGDYLQISDSGKRRAVHAELRDVLRDIHFGAPLGVFAVAGNVDSPDWPRIFRGTPGYRG